MIAAALEPARQQFKPAALKTLTKALALVIGTEAMMVLKDVRLILLQHRLAERGAAMQIHKVGRGRFSFSLTRPMRLLVVSPDRHRDPLS